MSIRHRVEKLEQASGSGFRVAHPLQLDRDGNSFGRTPAKDQVKGIRVGVEDQCIEVWRGPEETCEELEARSADLAREELQPTVLLPFDARFI